MPGAAGGTRNDSGTTPEHRCQRVRAGWHRVDRLRGQGGRVGRSNLRNACSGPAAGARCGQYNCTATKSHHGGAAVSAAVVVTRDEPADGPLSRELRALGLEVLGWPVLSIGTAHDDDALELALQHLNP